VLVRLERRGHSDAALNDTAPPIPSENEWGPSWTFIQDGLAAEIKWLREDFTSTCATLEESVRARRLWTCIALALAVIVVLWLTRRIGHGLTRPIAATTERLLVNAERATSEAASVRISCVTVADGSSTHQLADLQQAIRVLAWGTSVTTSAQPVLPSSADLVSAIAAWQKAKSGLTAGSSVRISTNNGSVELDLGKAISDPRSLLQARKLVNHSAEMIFVVEMPDYQATGQWQLKHGGTRSLAYSEPGNLLDKFYRRELDIRPGDALRCRVDFETSYGPDHEVLSERYRIVEILEVLPAARGADVQPLQPSEPARREAAAELEPAN